MDRFYQSYLLKKGNEDKEINFFLKEKEPIRIS